MRKIRDIEDFVWDLQQAYDAYEEVYFSNAKVVTTHKALDKPNAKLICKILKASGIDCEREGKKLIIRSFE